MKTSQNVLCKLVKYVLVLIVSIPAFSQEEDSKQTLEEVFTNYTQTYEEVMYAHLNKTKFIKGESIGFTVYALNKKNKTLSSVTTNVYCIVTDKNNKVVKEQMIKAKDGIAHASFKVDNELDAGHYNLKVFTNWMLNFDAQNIFTERFEVMSTTSSKQKKKNLSKTLDLQFLPESGHLLSDVVNTIGVIAKDTLGFGVGNVTGKIIDNDAKEITSFKLNKMGVGRFSLIPKSNQNYTVVISLNNRNQTINFNTPLEEKGVVLKVTTNEDALMASVLTNSKSIALLKNKTYKLTFHDGKSLNSIPIQFTDDLNYTSKIQFKNLSPGINIFTLFNEKNEPIAERLFFNFNGVSVLKSNVVSNLNINGSTNVNLQYNLANASKMNNVSVSVLPKGTISYQKNDNIISQTLLKPYVRGTIENANYYFTDVNDQKKYELDNLLITQGWSSYDWSKMFNYENNFNYSFDEGITIKFNIPQEKKNNKFILHPLVHNEPNIVSFKEDVTTFNAYKYFPENDEKLFISSVNNSGKLSRVPIYAQTIPSGIPNISNRVPFVNAKPNYFTFENFVDIDKFMRLNTREVLDEIEIRAKRESERIAEIKNSAFGRLRFLNDFDRTTTLAFYLNGQAGVTARDDMVSGRFFVRTREGVPALYLNDFFTQDYSFYFQYFLDFVEYVEINTLGMGPRNLSGGTIKIYENYKKFKNYRPTLSEIKFPITFTKAKKFYIPEYENYTSTFFKNYGVLDWFPVNRINESGNLNLSFNTKKNKEVVLFIEGITASGEFILEEKNIKIK